MKIDKRTLAGRAGESEFRNLIESKMQMKYFPDFFFQCISNEPTLPQDFYLKVYSKDQDYSEEVCEWKIQVKTCTKLSKINKVGRFNTSHKMHDKETGKRKNVLYTNKEADFIVLVCLENNWFGIMSPDEIQSVTTTISFGTRKTEHSKMSYEYDFNNRFDVLLQYKKEFPINSILKLSDHFSIAKEIESHNNSIDDMAIDLNLPVRLIQQRLKNIRSTGGN